MEILLLLLRLDRQTGDSSHLTLLGIDKSAALPVVLKWQTVLLLRPFFSLFIL